MRKLALLALVGISSTMAAPKFGGPTPKTTLLFSVSGQHMMTGYAVSADGRRVYYWQDSTQLYVFDRATRQSSRALEKMVGAASGLAVSPTANRLAFTLSAEGGGEQQLWTVSLDSRTGLPNGAPRRVSILAASSPAFSPDGQSIAFATPTSRTAKNLVVVPTNGGPERIIAETQGDIWPIAWSKTDSLYFGLSSREKERASKNGVYRVSVSSGKPQFVLRTPGWGAYPGLSPDGRFIVAYDSTWDSVVVATASGKRVRAYFDKSEEPTAEVWSTASKGVGSLRKRVTAIHAADLTATQDRVISDSGEFFAATWSPDGHRVASIRLHPAAIVVWNAAGGSRLVIPVEQVPSALASMHWSPDGRFLGYFARGGFYLVDVRASTVRPLAPKASLGPLARWRDDSRALIYAVEDPADNNTDSIKKIDIHEVALDGQDRVLHSFEARCKGGFFCGKIVDDSLVSTWINGEYRLTNFRARSAPRVIYTRDEEKTPHVPPVPTFSSNGRWMAVRQQSASDQSWSIEVMHPDGSAHRSVPLSFRVSPGGRNPWIRDDGAELIVASPDCTEGPNHPCAVGSTFYRVDVATGKATIIASMPHAPGASDDFMISANGQSLVYVREVEKGVDFYDLDFAGLLVGARQ